jgi:uncharacterized OB-fold protein
MGIPRFWRETPSRYNLIGTKCGNCDMIHFPPRVVCPSCHRKSIGKMERMHLSGKGTVVSYSIVHDAPHSFKMMKPYAIAMIELEGGCCRLTAPIIDCDPAAVKIGMEVEATFRKLGEQEEDDVIHYGYKFRPARSEK